MVAGTSSPSASAANSRSMSAEMGEPAAWAAAAALTKSISPQKLCVQACSAPVVLLFRCACRACIVHARSVISTPTSTPTAASWCAVGDRAVLSASSKTDVIAPASGRGSESLSPSP